MNTCPAADKPVCQHTRATDYTNHGCRCPAARADRERRRKQRHLLPPPTIDATGARRRLQALMAIGHSQNDLNEALGRQRAGSIGPVLWSRAQTRITRDLDQRIRDVYEHLWDQPGTGPRAELVAARAAARGWPPPLWWDDSDLDDPTFVPNYTPYRPKTFRERRQEHIEQVAQLSERGLSAAEIAERLGVTPRTVVRLRSAA